MSSADSDNMLTTNSGVEDDGSGSESVSEHSIENLTNSDSNRALRLNQRRQRKEEQLLSTQLFSSLCDQINACTDKHNEFLTLYEQSITNESDHVPNVNSFIDELENTVVDVTALYNELSELNKDKHDKTHETVFSEFIAGINEFKASVTANQETEKKLLEEEQRLGAAQRELDEKLKQFRLKNKSLRDRMASQVGTTPILTASNTTFTVSEVSSNDTNNLVASVHSQSDVINSGQNWIKELTTELTTGFAETLATKGERRRPKKAVEPDIFSGNPTEFNDWEIDWEAYMEAEELTEKEALRFIKKYLSGKAKECVIGLLSVNTPEAYRQVRRKLKERFSTEQDIAGIFKKRLRQWPGLQEPDGEKLLEFADFLDHIESSRSSVPGLYSLDEKEQNQNMSQKLPHDIRLKWVEIINQRKTVGTKYPSFKDFVVFVQAQAETYMNPIMKRNKPQKPVLKQNTESNRAGHGAVNKSYNTSTANEQPQRKPYCHFCDNNNHQTPNCGELSKRNYKEVMEFINSKRLCFRCAKHRGRAKECRNKVVCDICSKNHATVLHNPDFVAHPTASREAPTAVNKGTAQAQIAQAERQQAGSVPVAPSINNQTDKDVKQVYSTAIKRTTYNMMVPVYVSAGGNERLVYALMDNASDSCYIDQQVAQEIRAVGRQENVKMMTMNAVTDEKLTLFTDLTIRGYLTNSVTTLDAYQKGKINCNSEQIPTDKKCFRLPHLQKIAKHLPPLLDIPIGLLIGADCPQAIHYKDSIEGPEGEPFAAKTMFGWTLCGGKSPRPKQTKCLRTQIDDAGTSVIFRMVEQDFKDIDGKPLSQDDIQFNKILDSNTYQEPDGSYVMPLPFKSRPQLPNNRRQAVQRLLQLKTKLLKDQDYKKEYQQFMNNLLTNNHAEEVPESEIETLECWYIPHFGVRHPRKKKLRVVYDGSCRYDSMSLNDWLLKGPEQMNDLLGILLRFRLGKIAITCDIEHMFYNFKVFEPDRNFLRFLWFDNDLQTVKTYRMTRHIFGATSSPGVATYGLRKIAAEHRDISPMASTFLRRDVYVDDGISSVETIEEGKALVNDSRAICMKGNLHLHKFMSNKNDVLEDIPNIEKATINTVNENIMSLPVHRTLGVEWCVSEDVITYSSNLQPKPTTRRGILSTIAQVYDPLGLVSPFILQGKTILQALCRQRLEWDEQPEANIQNQWERWLADLTTISQVKINRHVKPDDFGVAQRTEVHHFADASEIGYGACSYLRMINSKGAIHCSLVLAKTRVAPLSSPTIPRMELQGAVTATLLAQKLRRELTISIDKEYFWVDSTVVLGYIKNTSAKFLPYVSNRVTDIRNRTNVNDWYHIAGVINRLISHLEV